MITINESKICLIITYFTANNLFLDGQHGFVPSRSCMTQLFTVFYEIGRIWHPRVHSGVDKVISLR